MGKSGHRRRRSRTGSGSSRSRSRSRSRSQSRSRRRKERRSRSRSRSRSRQRLHSRRAASRSPSPSPPRRPTSPPRPRHPPSLSPSRPSPPSARPAHVRPATHPSDFHLPSARLQKVELFSQDVGNFADRVADVESIGFSQTRFVSNINEGRRVERSAVHADESDGISASKLVKATASTSSADAANSNSLLDFDKMSNASLVNEQLLKDTYEQKLEYWKAFVRELSKRPLAADAL